MNSFFMRSAILVTACGSIIAAHAEQKTFKLKQTIPLPGVEGRIDHLALDAASDRLFVCALDRKSTRLNSSHSQISYAVFCLKTKNTDPCSRAGGVRAAALLARARRLKPIRAGTVGAAFI